MPASARRLWITEGTVEKHVHSILTKLRLPETDDDHRRVLAVITFLDAHQTGLDSSALSPSMAASIRRIAAADRSIFARNPMAELASIRSAYSASS